MKKLPYILLGFLLISSFTQDDHPFDKVMSNQKSDPAVQEKLRLYREEGIELPLEFISNDSSSTNSSSQKVDVEKIISTAKGFLGTKHVMGGTSKDGIDCSGMVMMSLKGGGIIVPHNSHGQGRYGKIIAEMDSLQRGDLVFFIKSYNSSYLITHSGICIGDKKFIHASASTGVITTDLNTPYWKTKFVFGTRIKY